MQKLVERTVINKDDVVTDILDQTSLYYQACEKVTDLKYEIKLQKTISDRIVAALDQEIRSTMKTKLTETAIRNKISMDEGLIKANEKTMETERQYEVAVNLKATFEMKAQMLGILGKDFKMPVGKSCCDQKPLTMKKIGGKK